ncbi:hypothetical protein L2E82_17513 [Cichorium intybus]|uniref:Uncharacterized protein n=1 Tax=Cichorium intybus TaxID=13427 RepID=A0ACB9F836_CICIN|nr:hypothetical protein L2E82_17513 [Cichorium intybus]
MALQKDEQSTNLLHSQAHIWNHIFSFIKSMSLKCAIELNIPDIINSHGAPMLLSELVEALSINKERAHAVHRLIRILVHSGFFVKQCISTSTGDEDEEEREGYLLAPVCRILLKEEPVSMRPFLLAMLDPILMDPFQHMSKWFQNDDINPFHTAHGRTFWDLAGQDSKLNQLFNAAMASDARLVASVILRDCGDAFKGLNSIVDVGGGTGTFAKAIAELFRMLVASVLIFRTLSMVWRVWILHDWNDEECIKILKRCKDAIPSKEYGGKLIIIEMVLKNNVRDKKLLETQLYFDLLMMVHSTGRERSEKDWANLFLDAGCSGYKITPISGLMSLIEVYP